MPLHSGNTNPAQNKLLGAATCLYIVAKNSSPASDHYGQVPALVTRTTIGDDQRLKTSSGQEVKVKQSNSSVLQEIVIVGGMPTEQSLTTTIKLSSGARLCLEKSEKGYGNK